MTKNPPFFLTLGLAALTLSILACGASAPAQPAEEQPAQPVETEQVYSLPETGTDPNAVIPCSQLIPPDELNNLLFNAAATLAETSYPGGTSCEWKYTANGASQESLFYIQTSSDASIWEGTRNSELSNEPSDLVVNSINGLGDESYVWTSKVTGQYVVYVRKGDKTLIMRFNPQDILYMANESGIIDMADRIFNRF
jgi:hypothetical protein